MTTGTITPIRTDFDTDVEERCDHSDADYSGWFCIATAPWPCPADGCDFVALHLTAAHMIVVFPRNDDPKLFAQARNARETGRNPKVVEYERSLGPCIPIDVWIRMGCPVHGQRDEPDGWTDRTGRSL